MADEQDWADYANQSVMNDTDTLLIRTAAGAGKEVPGTALARTDRYLPVTVASGPYVSEFRNSSPSPAEYCVSKWIVGAPGSAVGYVGVGGSATVNAAFANSFVVGTQNAKPVVFATGDAERARITEDGHFVLGHVLASSVPTNGVELLNYSGTVGFAAIGHATGTTAGNPYGRFCYSGTEIGSITQNGTTGVSYNTTSDRRLKENIAPAGEAGSLLAAIEIVQYDWKVGGHVDFGVIAQDAHTVLPDAVTPGDGGDEIEQPWAVDYSRFVPLLIKAHQEQGATIATLAERIVLLEASASA